MNRLILLGFSALVALGLAGIASAHMGGSGGGGAFFGMGPGMMGGYGGGSSYGTGPGMMDGYGDGGSSYGTPNGYGTEGAFRQFRKRTAPLRDELAAKQARMDRELAKDHPDRTRIAALQRDIVSLQVRITKAADEAGIDTGEGW
jgi:hypothetical protein